jgi:hypothetical protein
MYNRHQ